MPNTKRIFISYSHQDRAWKDRLLKHLGVLNRQDHVDIWDDARIRIGSSWKEEIFEAMESARAAIMLISADFLISDFIQEVEVPLLLNRRIGEGLLVFPIIIRPCDWQSVEWLADIQALPVDGVPLSAGDDHQIDTEFANIASEVRRLVGTSEESEPQPGNYEREQSELDFGLRMWSAMPLPASPFPLLLPYEHPELYAGRSSEIAELCQKLELSIPILGIHAPSGVGKSSLLLAGLVPTLRKAGTPTAIDRHPNEPGMATRLVGQLLAGSAGEKPHDCDATARFLALLQRARSIAERPPILILDQFEEALINSEARADVGLLLAATIQEQIPGELPLCRWILAHRRDAHGSLRDWLNDVLADARRLERAIHGLPHRLGGSDRFQSWRLPPLGTPSAGEWASS